jgi:hypothetical protein
MRDLVVDLQHQGSIERIRRELWIIGSPQERLDITEMLALGALLDIGDAFGVDVLSDDPAVRSNPAGGADAEPAPTGADISNDDTGFRCSRSMTRSIWRRWSRPGVSKMLRSPA